MTQESRISSLIIARGLFRRAAQARPREPYSSRSVRNAGAWWRIRPWRRTGVGRTGGRLALIVGATGVPLWSAFSGPCAFDLDDVHRSGLLVGEYRCSQRTAIDRASV